MSTQGKSDKKDRHRKSAQNSRYKAERRREKSHVRRIQKHLKSFPNDHYARQMLTRYKIEAGIS